MPKKFDDRLEHYGAAAEGRLAWNRPGKWLGYAAAGVASGLAGAPDSLEATPVALVNGIGSMRSITNTGALPLDVDGNGIGDVDIVAVGGSSAAQIYVGILSAPNGLGVGIAPYAPSAPISFPTNSFSAVAIGYSSGPATFFSLGAIPPGGTGLIGFQFLLNGTTPTNGWLRIAIGSGGPFGNGAVPVSITVLDGAYDDAGGTIPAGVPEPSSLATTSIALLALGAAGVSHYRKKKADQQPATASGRISEEFAANGPS